MNLIPVAAVVTSLHLSVAVGGELILSAEKLGVLKLSAKLSVAITAVIHADRALPC